MNALRRPWLVFGAILLTLTAGKAVAQTSPVATGTPPFGSFNGGPFDTVNLANGNVHFSIPVVSRPGRGVSFTYNLSYDTSVWYTVGTSGNQTWTPVQSWGFVAQTEVATGELTAEFQGNACMVYVYLNNTWVQTGYKFTYYNWTYVDAWGIRHPFNANSSGGWGNCSGVTVTTNDINVTAPDGSGYTITTHGLQTYDQAWITTTGGAVIYPPINSQSGSATYTDRNGNQITTDGNGNFTDTLGGSPVLSVTGTNPVNFTYKAPGSGGAGVNAVFKLNYTNYTVATNFGISGIHEYGPTVVALVSSIVLADNSQYALSYEPTPGTCTPLSGTSSCVTGRLASITLPTGGTFSYAYGGSNHGVFSDGTVPILTRTTPDGTWTYTRSQISGTHWQTVINDPTATPNQTVIDFQGLYETQRVTYQGSSSGGTKLQTIITCYNGNLTNCPTTAVNLPITRRTQTIQYPDATGKQCEHDAFYNTYGLETELDDYDYGSGGPGSLIRKVLTTYASLGNGIVDMPSSIKVQNSSGSTVAETDYTYDEGTVSSTSGTPQHVSISGSRGNATTIKELVGGTTFLTTTVVYFDTGNPSSITDVNGAQTSFNYPDATSTCGNAFPTSVTFPITNPQLTRSFSYNCVGGIAVTATDENGQVTTTTFSDPYFWRPASITDPTNVTTTFTYNGQTSVESIQNVNSGNAAADGLTSLDGLGRVHIQQKRQAPNSSNFDSVETDYDSGGRVSRTTVPYVGTAGQANSTAPAIISSYDALDRILGSTDGGGGSTTYTYNQNDVLISVGPAPTNENPKRRQLEYDALGRITSVCEITTGPFSGTCSQTAATTGFWTKYSYDAIGDLTGVTQNTQPNGSAQTRSYSYDGTGRLISETNPENGTLAYTYDASTDCNPSTFAGDLVKRVDAVGNSSCYAYDPIHRLTSVAYSGPYGANTPNKYFVYDAAIVNNQTMQNAKGRLAEAFTATCQTCSKITDLGFSYTARGEAADLYQMSPNSGGYYHQTASYWENGVLKQLSNLVSLPTMTYGLDGEGRISTLSASIGQNPLAATSYNAASLPTSLALGSGDNISYTYDASTNRMTQYQFNVNNQSDTGTLGWNGNGTLQNLSISDSVSGTVDTQSCSYSHDDLARVATANCGSVWSQTFSYDPFGNLNKSGSMSFQPLYSATTNRMTSLPGNFIPSYDANGNVLNDGIHTYTWNAENRPVTIDSATMTYDAFDRIAETSRNNAQFVYGPDGNWLGNFVGQLARRVYFQLPGGNRAAYDEANGGLYYYSLSDYLGNVRLASTPSRGVYGSTAFGPFGEPYATSGNQDGHFAGLQASLEVGLYDTLHREYSDQGRWASPDPAGLAAVDLSAPQSWNRYAYVWNEPMINTDPLGLIIAVPPGCIPIMSTYQGWPVATGVDCGSVPGGGGAPHFTCKGFVALNCGPIGPPPPNLNNNGGSTTWLQIKVFIQALGRNFLDEFKEGGCVAVFGESYGEGGFSHITTALTGSPDLPPNSGPDDVIRQASGMYSMSYQMSRGLTVPLRSSIYRGILQGGEKLAGGVAAVDFFARSAEGFAKEMTALATGNCR